MKKLLKRLFMVLLIIVLSVTVTGFIFMQQPQFGKFASGERLERIKNSPNYRDGKFQNLSETPDLTGGANYFTVMVNFFFGKSKRSEPENKLPSDKTDLLSLPQDKNVLIWFGHSSYFIQADGIRILVDPVLSGSASPVSFTTKSFPGTDIYTTDEIPEIDYLLLTHDHWDHLDYRTMLALKPKIKTIITGLGTGAHLEYWGFNPASIIEKDWNEDVSLPDGVFIHVASARHFSGRTFKRNQALWVSFVLKTVNHSLYIGGDSGFDTHFKQIGEKFGPFDLAVLECGQYNKHWANIHMMPHETVQAAIDLNAERLMPVHWSKFALALHDWDEPIVQVVRESNKRNMSVVHPLIGESVLLKTDHESKAWWVSNAGL
jgi:L-ascorbate metabolism protein UlaG (beta-lactamase superfamily)